MTRPKKVLILGSGPIVIGQAAEFDYAGTQACKAMREEGVESVLVNSNPATIMTDEGVADRIYIEPLTVPVVERIIERERPDGLLPTLGGQVGLNLAVDLHNAGVLDRYGVRLLGTPLKAIQQAEDRELFRTLMQEIGEPIPPSRICTSLEQARAAMHEIGLPVALRPAYTLGGTGGGFAHSAEELDEIAGHGLDASPIGQILVEKSLLGWKEIEYEVMRDGADTCITVCNMENLDPMGVHTGDSIVVCAEPDAVRQGLPDAALRLDQDHPRAGHRGRVQRPTRARAPTRPARLGRDAGRRVAALLRNRSQPAGEPVVGAGQARRPGIQSRGWRPRSRPAGG